MSSVTQDGVEQKVEAESEPRNPRRKAIALHRGSLEPTPPWPRDCLVHGCASEESHSLLGNYLQYRGSLINFLITKCFLSEYMNEFSDAFIIMLLLFSWTTSFNLKLEF